MSDQKKKSVFEVLQGRFPANEYALMAEVSDTAGHGRSNSADYIAVNLWPSRGLSVTGIELKSFRGDWLKEMKNPKKAENIFMYCDYFYLLTSDDKIAKLEEVPETWGWMAIINNKIKVMKQAPILKPCQLDKGFVVAMLKRACDRGAWVRRDSITDQIDEAYKRGQAWSESTSKAHQDNYNRLNHQVDMFHKESGINIYDRWDENGLKAADLGRLIKFLRDGGVDSIKKQLEDIVVHSESVRSRINASFKKIGEHLVEFTPADIESIRMILWSTIKNDGIKEYNFHDQAESIAKYIADKFNR